MPNPDNKRRKKPVDEQASEEPEAARAAGRSPAERLTGAAEAAAEVIVTISEKALDDLEAVTRRLEKAGLEVDHVLDFLGQITGRCTGDAVETLKEIDGVDDVAVSEKIQLPPPGSIIQ